MLDSLQLDSLPPDSLQLDGLRPDLAPSAARHADGDDALARMTAERLVDYLHLSGFELMKRPMVTDTGYIGGNR
jgi:hypothetical protein